MHCFEIFMIWISTSTLQIALNNLVQFKNLFEYTHFGAIADAVLFILKVLPEAHPCYSSPWRKEAPAQIGCLKSSG